MYYSHAYMQNAYAHTNTLTIKHAGKVKEKLELLYIAAGRIQNGTSLCKLVWQSLES